MRIGFIKGVHSVFLKLYQLFSHDKNHNEAIALERLSPILRSEALNTATIGLSTNNDISDV